MKVHCCRRWRATPKPSGSGGADKKGASRSAWARAVGEDKGVSLEGISRGYGDVTWRETGGEVGSRGEE